MLSYLGFCIIYTFIYALVFIQLNPLFWIAEAGYPITYVIISMLLGGLPFIFCNYLIMLARNSSSDLRAKNRYFALSLLMINLLIVSIVSIIHFFFAYLNIINSYINFNLVLLRSILFVNLDAYIVIILLYLSCFVLSFYLYLGGILRIKHFERGLKNE